MALEDTQVIDLMGLERDAHVLVLTLTDAWGWSEEEEKQHFDLLQAKLNVYLEAIVSGEAHAEFAKRSGVTCHPAVPVKISIRALHPLSHKAEHFISYARTVIESEGLEFEHVVGLPS